MASERVVPVRVDGSSFKKYPWQTDVLSTVHDIKSFYQDSQFLNLAQAISNAENNQTPGNRSSYFPVFLSHLSGKNEYGANSYEIALAQLKCLLPFRLLDVESMLLGAPLRTYNGLAHISARKRLPLEQLNNVPALYKKFRSLLSAHIKGSSAKKPKVHRKPGYQMLLYTDLSRRAARKQIDSVLGNLSAVALHGRLFLPDAIQDIESLLIDPKSKKHDEEELAALHSELENQVDDEKLVDGLGRARLMHNTLCVAAFLSPVLLLLPRDYSDIGGKEGLVLLWQCLGGLHRPAFLKQADRLLWEVIFSVAQGANLIDRLNPILSEMDRILDNAPRQWLQVVPNLRALPAVRAPQAGSEIASPSSNSPSLQSPMSTSPFQLAPSSSATPSATFTFPFNIGGLHGPSLTTSLTPPLGLFTLQGNDLPITASFNPSNGHGINMLTTVNATTGSLLSDKVAQKDVYLDPRSDINSDTSADNNLEKSPAPVNNPINSSSSNPDASPIDAKSPDPPLINSMDTFPEKATNPNPPLNDSTAPFPAETRIPEPPLDKSAEASPTDATNTDPPLNNSMDTSPDETTNLAPRLDDSMDLDPPPDGPVVSPGPTNPDTSPPNSNDTESTKGPGPSLRSSARLGEKASLQPPPPKPTPPKGNKSPRKKPLKKPKKPIDKGNEDDLDDEDIQEIEFHDLTLEETDDEDASYPEPHISLQDPIVLHSSSPVALEFTGTHDRYDFTPTFHLQCDLEWWKAMFEASTPYEEGDPFIKVVTKNDWEDLSYQEVAEVFSTAACVVVVDKCYVKPGFTKEAFSGVCSLDESTWLHDQSVFGADKLRKGTVNDMFASLQSEFPRALNALHFPALRDDFSVPSFATDYIAWMQTRGRAYFKTNKPYPVSDMRWAIASTGWTLHSWHVDANGYGTFVFVVAGIKIWFVAIPKDGCFDSFFSPNLYTGDFDVRKPHSDRWVIKRLVLEPGVTLVMRPNLPHAVVTPEARLFHHYVASDSISNTDHHEASRDVLMRVLTLYLNCLQDSDASLYISLSYAFGVASSNPQAHIPNPTNWDDLLRLFYLCAYFELYSALISWSYREDHFADDFDSSIKTRVRTRRLLYWVFSSHSFEHDGRIVTGAQAYEDIFSIFLARQAWLVILYKRAAWKSSLCGQDTLLTPSQTREDIQSALREGPAWKSFNILGVKLYNRSDVDLSEETFAWTGPVYTVKRIPPVAFPFPYSDGHVYGDRAVAQQRGLNINLVPRRNEDNMTDCWVEYTSNTRKKEDWRPVYKDSRKRELPTYAPGYSPKKTGPSVKPTAKRTAPDTTPPLGIFSTQPSSTFIETKKTRAM
ncbi:hypothetical protein H0H93_013252 [Arthromyces matolae]|nr:hypothetical protein H0H93_013252 [Arthromyces matolae]